jgi:hypothetical protein
MFWMPVVLLQDAVCCCFCCCRYITNVINLFVFAPCQDDNSTSPGFQVPGGWSLLHIENYPPQGRQRQAIPAYAVLKSADGQQLAVVIRGTRTAAEWRAGGEASGAGWQKQQQQQLLLGRGQRCRLADDRLLCKQHINMSATGLTVQCLCCCCCCSVPVVTDLSYAQVTDPSYPGMVSKGFLAGANTLWPALEATLQLEVLQGCVTSVTIAGHSLGAAMGTMLSYRAQVRCVGFCFEFAAAASAAVLQQSGALGHLLHREEGVHALLCAAGSKHHWL